jgi:hypothetical protein
MAAIYYANWVLVAERRSTPLAGLEDPINEAKRQADALAIPC